MCTGITRRQSRRSTCVPATPSAVFRLGPLAPQVHGAAGRLGDGQRQDARPELTGQAHARGDSMLVTAIGGVGRWYGRSCRTASTRVNHSERTVSGSVSVIRRTITRTASAMRSRSTAGIDPEHQRVGDVATRTDAEVDPAAGQVIEQDDAIRDHQGMVVGQADRAGAEPDVAGALGGDGQEDFRRGDRLPPARVMFADPRLVVAEPVRPRDELQIAFQRQAWANRPRRGTAPETARNRDVRHPCGGSLRSARARVKQIGAWRGSSWGARSCR